MKVLNHRQRVLAKAEATELYLNHLQTIYNSEHLSNVPSNDTVEGQTAGRAGQPLREVTPCAVLTEHREKGPSMKTAHDTHLLIAASASAHVASALSTLLHLHIHQPTDW